jgi:hypothetical protein
MAKVTPETALTPSPLSPYGEKGRMTWPNASSPPSPQYWERGVGGVRAVVVVYYFLID